MEEWRFVFLMQYGSLTLMILHKFKSILNYWKVNRFNSHSWLARQLDASTLTWKKSVNDAALQNLTHHGLLLGNPNHSSCCSIKEDFLVFFSESCEWNWFAAGHIQELSLPVPVRKKVFTIRLLKAAVSLSKRTSIIHYCSNNYANKTKHMIPLLIY